MTTKFTIVGDGAMGTACALLLCNQSSHEVTIWCQFEENCQLMEQNRENTRFLPGVPIPDRVHITSDFSTASGADAFVLAVPTVYLAGTIERLVDQWPQEPPVISVVKGMEQSTFHSPSQIVSRVLGDRSVAALSGPSHAEEISRGLPASVVAASGDIRLARKVQEWFTTDRFRVYTTHDLLGVELSGALKNIIAIAAGICDGLQFGDNAKSALVSRGLVEMLRFGERLGAEAETFYGLAGLGDLITTCISRHSRNRHVGEQLGRGRSLDEVLQEAQSVAEGIWTTRSVNELALKRGIDMPVTHEVHQIMFGRKDPMVAVNDLMTRDPKPER